MKRKIYNLNGTTMKDGILICICEEKDFNCWDHPDATRVFDDEKGFCAICPYCGMWHN